MQFHDLGFQGSTPGMLKYSKALGYEVLLFQPNLQKKEIFLCGFSYDMRVLLRGHSMTMW